MSEFLGSLNHFVSIIENFTCMYMQVNVYICVLIVKGKWFTVQILYTVQQLSRIVSSNGMLWTRIVELWYNLEMIILELSLVSIYMSTWMDHNELLRDQIPDWMFLWDALGEIIFILIFWLFCLYLWKWFQVHLNCFQL